MVFSSITFICVFLPCTFLLHEIIPNIKGKNALLILASLVFYAYGEPIYVLLMILSTLLNWLFGNAIQDKSNAKVLLLLAIIFNLGFLGFFKYANFFVDCINHFGLGLPSPNVALPIGISFYTFQAMSYVIDVYRGEVKAQKNYFNVLLYISFFPQLIAGPIVKYHDIEKELLSRHASLSDKAHGLMRFIVGLSKKVLLANTFALVADACFAAKTSEMSILIAWTGAIFYMLQIYFDFSGYSDMAIGMARMFGFHFQENFNYPYISSSIKEFWRRWHISLSTWFRDYLYIPLGGSRHGKLRTIVNKWIVFILCGFWHGAGLTFILWGVLHGFFLMLEEILPIRRLPKALGVVYSLLVVCCLFVVFRADTISQAGLFLTNMFTGLSINAQSYALFMQQMTISNLFFLVVGIIGCTPLPKNMVNFARSKCDTKAKLYLLLTAQFTGAIILLFLVFMSLASSTYNPFIYFRF